MDLARAHPLSRSLVDALPWFAVQAQLELARAHVTLRDADAARALLTEIAEILDRRPGLGVLAEQAEALRHQVETMPGTDGGASGLTSAELRVLPLLQTHLSFREIGERQFVSRNTIKTQAISIYRKLGVSSRSGAIERAVGVRADRRRGAILPRPSSSARGDVIRGGAGWNPDDVDDQSPDRGAPAWS